MGEDTSLNYWWRRNLRLERALRVIRSYVGDPTATPDACLAMMKHWADEALAGREVPFEAGISGPG